VAGRSPRRLATEQRAGVVGEHRRQGLVRQKPNLPSGGEVFREAGRSRVGEVATNAPYAALSGFRVDHPGCVAGAFQGQIRHADIVFEIEAPLRECSDVTAGLLEVPTVDRFDC